MMWRKVMGGACVAAVFGLLAGCGGSSATAANTGGGSQSGNGGGTTPPVQGIATPSSVSVVTATNSN
ncbi:MAG TPA: hypothetical protein VGO18_09680 [Steroidobacteraceae bacterium]|jgi:hypothetical protein|nr:hypothetical protein [Steroidobacteraceae bacterium]